jgi:DNA-binding PadR family transcriptional regulator
MGSKKDKNFYKKPFVGVPREILNSYAYLALNFSARSLYLEIRLRMNGFNNGDINATLSELKHRGFKSPATLAKCLRQLEAVGLIAKTRATIGVENGSKVCNLYRLTDIDVLELSKLNICASKATDSYRKITSLKEAKRLVKHAALPKKKISLQNLDRDATEVVAKRLRINTENEFGTERPHSESVASINMQSLERH